MNEKRNIIKEKSFEFALLIIEYSEILEENRKYSIAKQLLRSGTSIGANIREAQSSESAKDFIHKMKIAAKKADETEYWILLCKHSKSYPDSSHLFFLLYEIQKMLSSIISTTKKKLNN